METANDLYQLAKVRASNFRTSQKELLEILIRIDRHQIYRKFDYPSLHDYCTLWLGLSEGEAYTLCGIAKKSHEIPKMKTLIDEGKLHVSNARRIVKWITPDNQEMWLEKASTLTQNELRREIVTRYPEAEDKERIRPITKARSRLELGISKDLEGKLKKLCDLLSKKKKRSISMEEALEFLTDSFLEKHDPVSIAERSLCPDTNEVPKPGRFTSAQTKHLVNLRDRGQCTFRYPDGMRCKETRWTERHHVQHVANGDLSISGNLMTLRRAV